MNLSFPRATLKLLQSRIPFLNSSSNNNNLTINENFHKARLIKKVYKLNEKTKNYINKRQNLKPLKKNIITGNEKINKIKQIKLIKSKYFHNEILRKNINSPLKREYKRLLSNLPNNKRCFMNLRNKDLDSIFKFPNNSTKLFTHKKELMIKKGNNSINSSKKKDNKKFVEKPKITIHFKLSTNSTIHRSKSLVLDKIDKSLTNITFKNKDSSLNSANKDKQTIKLIDRKKKYSYLMTLMKRNSNKNLDLLIDIKKEETKNKDLLLSSLAKFSVNDERIKRKIHNYNQKESIN